MDYIKYNGTDYPFYFRWSTFKKWLSESSKMDEFEIFDHAVFLGFQHGAKIEKQTALTKEKLTEMIDDDPNFQSAAYEQASKDFGEQKKRMENLQKKMPKF